MLWPVEFDASRNPRTCKSHKGGFDHVVVINKVALLDLVISHLYASAQFGQHHHLDVFVLHPNGQIILIHLLVAHGFDHGIRINHTT